MNALKYRNELIRLETHIRDLEGAIADNEARAYAGCHDDRMRQIRDDELGDLQRLLREAKTRRDYLELNFDEDGVPLIGSEAQAVVMTGGHA